MGGGFSSNPISNPGGARLVSLPSGGVRAAPAELRPELPADPMEFMRADPIRWHATYTEGSEGPAAFQISRLIVG